MGEGSAEDPAGVLRREILDRVERLASERTDAGEIGEIERLDRLLQIYERARPAAARPRRRLPVLLILFLSAGLVWLLLFTRIPCTEVAFDLQLSSLAFRIAPEESFRSDEENVFLTNEDLGAARITFKGVDAIELDGQPIGAPAAPWLALASAEPVALHRIGLPAGTWVRIDTAGRQDTLSLSLSHASSPVAVALTVPIEARVAGEDRLAAHLADSEQERLVELVARPGSVLEVAITPPEDAATSPELLRRELRVQALVFEQIENELNTRGKSFSTVLGGEVYLEALAGSPYPLRRSEYLSVEPEHGPGLWDMGVRNLGAFLGSFECPAAGHDVTATITTLAVEPDRLTLQARGHVQALTAVSHDNPRDLMPRWLAWLQARQEWILFWGAFFALFPLLLRMVQWWWDIGS